VNVAVIGVGLIGGSIGLAARERVGATVAGYGRRRGTLEKALQLSVIDRIAPTIAEAVADAELAFVCVPVHTLAGAIAEVLEAAPHTCVVSDVGSTKRSIVEAISDERFVGGHPLAGAETAGVEHARADLFEGATWYLTPAASTSGILYERLHRFLRGLGAVPAAIEPDLHDTLLATVSHLPHVLANVLVTQAAALSDDGDRLPVAGPSFRDLTRVAGAPSEIWTDIYTSNADALVAQIDQTIARLTEARQILSAGDAAAITAWNDAAAVDRRRLVAGQFAEGELHELRVSVPNRPGVVAQLALGLGRAGVNIADMALYPAADMSEGVVALWVAGDAARQRTLEVASEQGFPIAPAE
jgi:prephenate dehydrogenase